MVNIEIILNNISERIEEIKKEKGWTTKQFADFVGIPRTTVNSWIWKEKVPRIDLLYKMADAFNVTVDYLIGREE